MPVQYLQPAWPAPEHVRAAFTTRAGGVSSAPFDSFNLGDHVNDRASDVARNRALLQQTLGARAVFLKQVHGVEVANLDAGTLDGTAADAMGGIVADRMGSIVADAMGSIVADACTTQQRGVACTIMVADCLPMLFTDTAGSFVAAAHAGWRGLLGQGGVGVLEAVSQAIFKSFMPVVQVFTAQPAIKNVAPGPGPQDIIAWLGPCIGPQQFEVGAEVRAAFVAQQPDSGQYFEKLQSPAGAPEKFLANLPGLARARLQALGITQIYGNDGSDAWCTVRNESLFFSHRRDAARLGSTGRMAACIWLAG